MYIVVISGPIAAGKSSLAKNLGCTHLSTREVIKTLFGNRPREELQQFGKQLDLDRPQWVTDAVTDAATETVTGFMVVDSARVPFQIDHLRQTFGTNNVLHVHLTASHGELSRRYEKRGEVSTYHKVITDSVERTVDSMQNTADLVIDTSRCRPEDTLTRVRARMHKPPTSRNVDVLVGGQYGSEGKGHVVAHIADEYEVLVRVGGPNAGHTVLYNGNKVSFYHLPSGVLHSPNASIFLGAGININPRVLKKEIELAESLGVDIRYRLFIDNNANLITDEDIEIEAELVGSIGSTGQGVGAATAARIMERGKRTPISSCEDLKPFLFDFQENIRDCYESGDLVLLEGTQGTGLSLFHGPYPYVTSRDTTVSGTMGDAGIAPGRIRKVIMVVRTNPIRVQSPADSTSGPMGQEVDWETIAARAGVDVAVLREREKTTTTKRMRRVSEFDWALLQRSAQLNCPTDIALTFADYISPKNTEARRYEQLTPETQEFINEVEVVANAPVSLITTRLHERSIIDRRKW